jgi:hypothetical protein
LRSPREPKVRQRDDAGAARRRPAGGPARTAMAVRRLCGPPQRSRRGRTRQSLPHAPLPSA